LPQVKLGWIAVDGPKALVHEALERLELICDTYLSVSTSVQLAAPDLILAGAGLRRQVTERVRRNLGTLCASAEAYRSTDVLATEAGWSAVLRVPSRATEEALVIELIERDGVIVHPGYFFDFPHEAFLVLSLLPEAGVFAEGVRRLLERVDA
jgi:aspartate/methionine/tyrosine aminotransferase